MNDMTHNKSVSEAIEREKQRIRQRYQSIYFGKDDDGLPHYVDETAVDDFIDQLSAALTSIATVAREEERERVKYPILTAIGILESANVSTDKVWPRYDAIEALKQCLTPLPASNENQ